MFSFLIFKKSASRSCFLKGRIRFKSEYPDQKLIHNRKKSITPKSRQVTDEKIKMKHQMKEKRKKKYVCETKINISFARIKIYQCAIRRNEMQF